MSLAQDRAELQALRTKLSQNQDAGLLFNTTRFARHIEAAYTTMYAKLLEGQKPTAFAVTPIE